MTKKYFYTTILLIAFLFTQGLYAQEEVATTTEEVVQEEVVVPDAVEEEVATSTPVVEVEAVEMATSTPLDSEILATSTATSTLESFATSTDSTATSTSTTTPEVSSGANGETATSTPEEGPEIMSGRAIALANILNMVNANFINSSGVILFSNFFDQVRNSIDLRSLASSTGETCTASPCALGSSLNIHVNNNANIENELLLHAISGRNSIENGGNSSINTGDAYAGLNLINVANTNFVDSEYLLVTMNAFQGVNGDVVFPSLSNFFSSLAAGAVSASNIDIHNAAQIENNVNVESSSGENAISSSTSSTIETGNTRSSTNVFNEINTSLIGNKNVSILFKVHGNWAGEIFGAPENLAWTESPDGSIALFDLSGSAGGASSSSSNTLNITASSSASIKNNVSVIALTGENEINNAEHAVISTGNAYAGANIVNIANGNVIGRNWILAIINIFGDFNGNIAFGRPDLWIGEQVDTPAQIQDGEILNYKFTILNNGDSQATDVEVVDDFDSEHLEIMSSSADYSNEGGSLKWYIEDLPPGAGTEIQYRARVRNVSGGAEISNVVRISARETDENIIDNSDSVTLRVERKRSSSKNSRKRDISTLVAPTLLPISTVVTVTRNNPFLFVNNTDKTITQELTIFNSGNVATAPLIFHDIIYDSNNRVVKDEVWDLGVVGAREEITISYDMKFQNQANSGLYTLSTVLSQSEGDDIQFINNGAIALAGNPVLVEKLLVKQPQKVEVIIEDEPQEEGFPQIIETAHAAEEVSLTANTQSSGFSFSKLFTYIKNKLKNLF